VNIVLSIFTFVFVSLLLQFFSGLIISTADNIYILKALNGAVRMAAIALVLYSVCKILDAKLSAVFFGFFDSGVFSFIKSMLASFFLFLSLHYLPLVFSHIWNSVIAFKVMNICMFLFLLGAIVLGNLFAIRHLFRDTFYIRCDYKLFFLSSKFLIKSSLFYALVPTVVACYIFSVKIKEAISNESFTQTMLYISIDAPFVFLFLYLVKKLNEAGSIFDSGDATVSAASVAENVADAASERIKDFL
jgi:hypothetical protein